MYKGARYIRLIDILISFKSELTLSHHPLQESQIELNLFIS